MREFTLQPKEEQTLKINIGEESFVIPLGGSMTRKELASLDTQEGTYSFFRKYIPKAILEQLKMDDYNQIVNIWLEETAKASGKKLGES